MAPCKFAKTASLMALTTSSKPGTKATKSFTDASRVMTTSPRTALFISSFLSSSPCSSSSSSPPTSSSESFLRLFRQLLSSPNFPSIFNVTVSSKLNSFGMPSNSSFFAFILIDLSVRFGINAIVVLTTTLLPRKSNGKSSTFQVFSSILVRLFSSGKVTERIRDPSET